MNGYIDRRAEVLGKKRVQYEKAKLELANIDLQPALNLIFSYQKGDSPESAIFILAQCQALLKTHRDLCNIISAYEREKDTLDKLANNG